LGITLDFLNGYDEILFIEVPLGFKIVFKYLNSSRIDGDIQTKTIKVRRFFYDLLHMGCLLWKLSCLILKFKYDNIFHAETKVRVEGGLRIQK